MQRIRHGMSKSKTYKAWAAMKHRCYNPANKEYASYGGRGIGVCEEWRNSFLAFLADMGPVQPGQSIDRIDNNGNYEPGNCRWASYREQQSNRQSTKLLTFNGKTQSPYQWAREMGLPPHTFYRRVFDYGWPLERALFTPKLSKKEVGLTRWQSATD